MLEEIREILEELLDENFPKGECKERGQAIVLVAKAIIEIKEVLDRA